jgi:putative hydrolase of the HAD superfamily
VDLAEARLIQKRYFVEQGTTLAGLMKHQAVDPHHYLDFVHDVDLGRLTADPQLAAAINALPGRKLIFTNADLPYANRVLEKRGLADCFEAVFDIHDAAYRPKPELRAYEDFCVRHDVDPTRAVMFEDMARNLRPAKQIGMGTLWVNNGSEHGAAEACASFIDHETPDLTPFLSALTGVSPA